MKAALDQQARGNKIVMRNYLNLLKRTLDEGVRKNDRTETGTISLFGPQLEFNLTKNFPAVTTKKLYFHGVVHELLWFLKGSTNIDYLKKNNVNIWDDWADEDGELGPVYGKQWRDWKKDATSIDQISSVISNIKNNPHSRRHIVSAWNVGELEKMALPPCHVLFQFYVNGDYLSCKMYQRSADLFLGVPFNIASYSLLTHMVAQVTGYKPGRFIHTFGDAHIYCNHIEQVQEQLNRTPFPPPTLSLNESITAIDSFERSDIELKNYNSHDAIAAPIAV